jgi:hypothetical protein
LELDLVGQVHHTALAAKNALMPMFEAVINSIFAIQEQNESDQGTITIRIKRESKQETLEGHGPALSPIKGFLIQDNGIGFTKRNYRSFNKVYDREKQVEGRKGIGRLLWLVAFKRAEIDSTFREDGDEKWCRRKFSFILSPDGISDHEVDAVPSAEVPEDPKTTVELVDFKPKYAKVAPKSAEIIARRILEHCIKMFVLGKMPRILLIDEDAQGPIDLNSLFENEYHQQTEQRTFSVDDQDFKITDVLLKSTKDMSNQLHFIGSDRVVESIPLESKIPHLHGPFEQVPGVPALYSGFVSGDFLDKRVNTERGSFNIDREDDLQFEGGPTWEKILNAGIQEADSFLRPFTAKQKEESISRIRDFIENDQPKYKPLLVHKPEQIESISPHLSERQLDSELYRIQSQWKCEVRERIGTQTSQIEASADDFTKHKEEYIKTLGEFQEVTKSDLAEYVTHRAAVISFFEALLGKQDDEKFATEGALHSLFFPRKTTSDEVDYDDHSLWLIDERLSYHKYLASDKAFEDQSGPIQVDGKERPDIIIYNNPIAFSHGDEPYHSVVIIEFKRPERTDYTLEVNPIDQVQDYMAKIRKGTAETPDGSTIQVPEGVPFYVYIIATLNQKLKELATKRGFVQTPDNFGYFWYNPKLNEYIEILSFKKILGDAKKRNRAFLDRLQIRI